MPMDGSLGKNPAASDYENGLIYGLSMIILHFNKNPNVIPLLAKEIEENIGKVCICDSQEELFAMSQNTQASSQTILVTDYLKSASTIKEIAPDWIPVLYVDDAINHLFPWILDHHMLNTVAWKGATEASSPLRRSTHHHLLTTLKKIKSNEEL